MDPTKKQSYKDAPVSGTHLAVESLGQQGQDVNIHDMHEPSTPFIPLTPVSPTLAESDKNRLPPTPEALKVGNNKRMEGLYAI